MGLLLKKTKESGLTALPVLPVAMMLLLSARPALLGAFPGDGESTFRAKCSICHGVDGSGNTATGKKLKMRDLRADDVQKQTDAQLAEIIAKGKKDMPGYEKKLKETQIKELVAYLRDFAKEKKK